MKSELIERLRDVNKNFLPILLENNANKNGKDFGLGMHFDAFLDQVKNSFNQNNELICIVPTFYQLDDISPWKTREFNYLKAYSLADRQTFQQILNTQVTLSRKLNARFSKTVLHHLNSDGWNGRCTVLIRIVEDSEEVTLEYDDEFDLLKYCIGDGTLKTIKDYVYSLFPEIPRNFFTVTGNNKADNIISLDFKLKESKKEIRELRSFIKFSQDMNPESPADSTIRSLQKALIEPVLQHSIFLQPGWEMYYSFSNSIHYNRMDQHINIESDYGLGGAFVIVDKDISLHDEFDRFIMLVERIVDKLANRVVNYHQLMQLKDKTTLAQVAEVVNRNYAHHIGSHVSRRASFEKILERLKLSPDELTKEQIISIAAMRSRLEKYKDERSEFIASVTNSSSMQTSGLYQDVIRPFVENTLFIDNIGKNEGICYHFEESLQSKNQLIEASKSASQLVVRVFVNRDLIDIQKTEFDSLNRSGLSNVPENYVELSINYKDSNGNTMFSSLSLPYYLGQNSLDGTFYENYSIAYPDIKIGLPGGLGKHALYSFLENYIRNVAKHSYLVELHRQKPVEIILKLDPEYNKSDVYKLTITDNISNAEKVEVLKEKLGKDIYDKTGGMGIADMKICACLLSGKKLNDANLAESLKILPDNGHIAYQFNVLKPKEIALIGCEKERANETSGVFYFDTLQLFIKDGVHSHSFNFGLISDDELVDIEDLAVKHLLPRKTIVIGGLSEKHAALSDKPRHDNIELEEGKLLIDWCWKEWIKAKYPTMKSHLGVYFEQKESETPTKEWLDSTQSKVNGSLVSIDIYYDDLDHEIYPPIEAQGGKAHLYLDRHARLIKSLNSSDIDFLGPNFWSLIDKNNPDFDLLISTDVNTSTNSLIHELAEMARMNVLVIDERVSEAAHMKYVGDDKMRNLVTRGGFRKFSSDNTTCELIDACWASNIYIATHLNGNPVSNNLLCNEDKSKNHHFNKVKLKQVGKQLQIEMSSNFFENIAEYKKIKPLKYGWHDSSGNIIETYNMDEVYRKVDITYDALIIHRTILKKLLEDHPEKGIIKNLDVQKIYVVTGGGAIDFLPEDYRISILPSNILYDFILSKRPAKLSLCRRLK